MAHSSACAWATARQLDAGSAVLLHGATPKRGPYAGHKELKVCARDGSGAWHHELLRLDADGNALVDAGAQARDAWAQQQWVTSGNISERLATRMASSKSGQPISVSMWLSAPYVSPDKSNPLSVWLAEADYSAAWALRAGAAVERLAKLGIIPTKVEQPQVFFTASASQLSEMKHDPIFGTLGLDEGTIEPQGVSTTWHDTLNAGQTGYDGTGVKVCLIENTLPAWAPQSLTGNFITLAAAGGKTGTSTHFVEMAQVIAGSGGVKPGIAPGVQLYGYGQDYYPLGNGPIVTVHGSCTWCAGHDTNVWNYSQGEAFNNGWSGAEFVRETDRRFDYAAIHHPYPTIVAAAGNAHWGAYTHNKLQNGVVVGASSEGAGGSESCDTYAPTSTRSDDGIWYMGPWQPCGDQLCQGSMWTNPNTAHDDWELPHVVAPGFRDCVQTAEFVTGATSAATAMVTASVALLMEATPSLTNWPEGVRALLAATSVGNVSDGELSAYDPTDQRDGAGLVDVARLLFVAGQQVSVPSSSNPTSNGWNTFTVQVTNPQQFVSGTWTTKHWIRRDTAGPMRVALAFNAHPDCDIPQNCPATSDGSAPLVADLDLVIIEETTGNVVAASPRFDSATEFVRFPALAGVTYRVEVWRYTVFDTNNPSTYLGLAWHAE